MNVRIPSGRLCMTNAIKLKIPSLYKLLSLFPFSFSINLFKIPTIIAPIPKNVTNKNMLLPTPGARFGSELGIKSNKLTINITLRDNPIENARNSSFFFTGINMPMHPNTVDKPAIDDKTKGHTISIILLPSSIKICKHIENYYNSTFYHELIL